MFMYRKKPKGWLKHWDFILLEIICLQVSYVLAYYIRHREVFWHSETYLAVAFFLFINELVITYFNETFKNVLKRGLYGELTATIKHIALIILVTVFGMYVTKYSNEISRLTIFYCGAIHLALSYFTRIIYKKLMLSRMNKAGSRSLLIIASRDEVESILEEIYMHNYEMFIIRGIVLTDNPAREEEIKGVPVVCPFEGAPEFVCREWVDEVMFFGEASDPKVKKVLDRLFETGVTVHFSVANLVKIENKDQIVERVAGQTVVTMSLNYASPRQLLLKRLIDILAGLAGSIVTIILAIIFGPLIFISSPGNIFFTQERIGRNGKRFRIIKFRTMYPDAEERKKEYMDQNRNADGMMFKLDFDPRIIGNRVTAGGKKKTGLGQFLRDHSIDEFPQFFNVLLGQMSLVGTRPPTPDEWDKYDLHHRARLTIKPGITGLWQVSGRSEITDFEEVVRLDREYITKWTMGRDFRIILKTIWVVLRGSGAM